MAYIGQSIKNGTFTDLSFSGTFNRYTTAFNLGYTSRFTCTIISI